MGIHNEQEVNEKRQAVNVATKQFATEYLAGHIQDELLLHEIESLYQLVVELKRG